MMDRCYPEEHLEFFSFGILRLHSAPKINLEAIFDLYKLPSLVPIKRIIFRQILSSTTLQIAY